MKKLFLIIYIVALCAGGLSSCAGKKTDSLKVNIAVIKGPSSIGMIKLMDDSNNRTTNADNFSFEIFASADEIVPKIVQRKIDIAAVPPNLSSILYNNTHGKVQVIAISTLGMMYIVENGGNITSLEDLRGRTIYAGFKGKSPEYDLNYILTANGIQPDRDLVIEWKSEHTESVAALSAVAPVADNTAVAVLPQPFATAAQMLNENIRIAIDLNKEWEKLQEKTDKPSALITGVIIAHTEFIEQNPAALSDFLERYAASAQYANSNIDETAALVGIYNIFPEETARRAIPYCNITFIEGREMKEKLSGYLNVLFEQNPQSIGGALPNDEFYFIR